MADITIHGIDKEVIERLGKEAETYGLTLEELICHILSVWEQVKELPVYVPVENTDQLEIKPFKPMELPDWSNLQPGIDTEQKGGKL